MGPPGCVTVLQVSPVGLKHPSLPPEVCELRSHALHGTGAGNLPGVIETQCPHQGQVVPQISSLFVGRPVGFANHHRAVVAAIPQLPHK